MRRVDEGPPALGAELHLEGKKTGEVTSAAVSPRFGVIGLGYVGLPLAVEFGRAGFHVTGIDVDPKKVATIRAGESHVEDVAAEVYDGQVIGVASFVQDITGRKSAQDALKAKHSEASASA